MVNPTHQAAVVQELQRALYPSGALNEAEAWLGLIQVLCWYDYGYLHIIDGDKLNPVAVGRKTKSKQPRHDGPWQNKARAAEAHIEQLLGLAVGTASSVMGRMWTHPLWVECVSGNQKANPVGNALRYLGTHVLQLWGDQRLDFREEQPLADYFPGFSIPGVHTPKADILAVERVGSAPAAVISCKWSMRTDRVSECHKECSAVKSVSHRVQRAVKFYVLCHEYDPSRIVALLSDSCIDGVALLNLPILQALGLATPLQAEIEKGRVFTLEQLIQATQRW